MANLGQPRRRRATWPLARALLWLRRMAWSRLEHSSSSAGIEASEPQLPAPGKRTLTDRLQRRASGTVPATTPSSSSSVVQLAEGNGLSCDQSFLDSILVGPVQRRSEADGEAVGADVHALAAHGTSGSGGALPHLERIQASFGAHDVGSVQAHTDSAASDAARGMGAHAFATGNHVAFGGTPDLHTAAHEAAHVVQQRAGVHLKGGVGEVGDAHEQHADAVADRVVRGESAEDLLSAYVAPCAGGAPTSAVQQKAGGAEASNLDARILSYSVVDGATKVTIGAGTRHGVRANMSCRLVSKSGGTLGAITIHEVADTVSYAITPKSLDAIKEVDHIVINPTEVEEAWDLKTRLLGSTQSDGGIRLAIGAGSAHGVRTGMNVRLVSKSGRTIDTLTIGEVRERTSYATWKSIDEAVKEVETVVVNPSSADTKATPANAAAGAVAGAAAAAAVQRKESVTIAKPGSKEAKEGEADLKAHDAREAEDQFLSTIVYYLQPPHFRAGSGGPAKPRPQKTAAFHELAEQVRSAQLIYVDHKLANRERKAIDAWGVARHGVMNAIQAAAKRGSAKVDDAVNAVATADAHFAGDAVDKATDDAANQVNITSPDSAFLLETQKAVDKATTETMRLLKEVPADALPRLRATLPANVSIEKFEEWHALVLSTHNLDERLKKAKAKGVAEDIETIADFLRYAMILAKGVVTGLNELWNFLQPVDKKEVKELFLRLAKVTGDATITKFADVFTTALAVIQVVAGTWGLVRGIASGDVKQAIKGAQRIALGGTSVGLLGVGAGIGASLMSAGGVMIFFGTLEAVVEVGALLRDLKRQKTIKAAYEFIQDAAMIAVEARQFAATLDVMLSQDKHSSDPTMQAEVEERIKDQAMKQGAKLARRLQWLGQQMWSHGKDSIGGYPDLVQAMGANAHQSLSQLATGIADEPLMVAQHATLIFAGISEMGRYAMEQYGKPI